MKKTSIFSLHSLKIIALVSCLFAGLLTSVFAKGKIKVPAEAASITGRWDITLTKDGKTYPSWLEVYKSGHSTLLGQYTGIVGCARPISSIQFADNKLSFAIPPQWEDGKGDLTFAATFAGDSLSGTLKVGDGDTFTWTGVRAPTLTRTVAPSWGKPVKLFDGSTMAGWKALGTNQWIAKDGILQSPKSGANLITEQTFNDFKLHIEFRYPEGSNSGVYLRGRYEVQIEAEHDTEPYKNVFSGVYGFIAPSQMVAKKAGEWQTYDITLIGRMVTVVANGTTVICNQEIPGITGGAINSKEGEAGPLLIQGDHGPIEFRNIVITPAK